MWIEPKTDWTADDFFNASDWNRIIGNMSHLHDRAKDFSWKLYRMPFNVGEQKDYSSMLYAREFNRVEEMLTLLNKLTYNLVTDEAPIYEDNGATPTYEELNRIESLIKEIYDTMDRVEKSFRYSGTFYCGQERI